MRRLVLVLFSFIACVISICADVTPVAGWGIYAMGGNRHHLAKVDGDAFATLSIQDDTLLFSIWGTESQIRLGPSIIVENIYLEQSVAEGDSFIGMESKVKMADNYAKTGVLYLSLSKKDTGSDIIHFDFGDEDLYIIGELIKEDMFDKLAKLAGVGLCIKEGAKLKIPLKEAIR